MSAGSPELEEALTILMGQPTTKPARKPKVKPGCGTCAYAEFSYTDTGRIRRNTAGRCMFEVQIGPVPACAKVRVDRIFVHPNMGKDCPTWIAKA